MLSNLSANAREETKQETCAEDGAKHQNTDSHHGAILREERKQPTAQEPLNLKKEDKFSTYPRKFASENSLANAKVELHYTKIRMERGVQPAEAGEKAALTQDHGAT